MSKITELIKNRGMSYTEAVREILHPSALPLSEPQGQCERSGLATCSLPVSSVERLLAKWEARAKQSAVVMSHNPRLGMDYRIEIAATQRCLDDLRAEMAAATERQPEENVNDEPRRNGRMVPPARETRTDHRKDADAFQ
jgi:hypothetical protein